MEIDESSTKVAGLLEAAGILDHDRFFAARAKDLFLLCVLKEDCIEEDSNGNVVINIPYNPAILHVGKERKVIEREVSKLGYFRWAAGGGAIKIKTADPKSILVTVRKDEGSPSYANHDTMGAGLSSDDKEWIFPLCTAVREGMEEIIIKDKDNIIYPKFDKDLFGMSYDIRYIAEQNRSLYKILSSCGLRAALAKFIDFGAYGKELTVRFRDQEEKISNVLVNVDKGCGGIDVITTMEINVESRLDELVLLDGEESQGRPFDRIINAWELEGNIPTGRIIASWKSGQRIETQKPGPMVPHTKQLFEALANL